MTDIKDLEQRNKQVEGDKAWEISWTRKIAIVALIYLVVISCLTIAVHIDPWVNAIVPVLGFFLSTLTISVLKKYWLSPR